MCKYVIIWSSDLKGELTLKDEVLRNDNAI